MRILGIETSCDETAAAIVERNKDGRPEIIGQNVLSQFEDHQEFGGVVPEIAARAHLTALDHLIIKTIKDAQIKLSDLDAVAATTGPGLVGGLIVGMMTAKAIAATNNIPFLAINHLEGHALTARLTHNIEFPYLLLLVSGGHTQILCVNGLGKYHRLATTIDDALGEAFDKTAKLLGLPQPGGPNVELAAKNGDPKRFRFPRPLQGKDTLNMSFSGLKTSVRQQAEKLAPLSKQDVADICACFQIAVSAVLVNRCKRAMQEFSKSNPVSSQTLVAAGGVAANQHIRTALKDLCQGEDWNFVAPPLALCSDNAAMIAWAGLERAERGESSPMNIAPRSRWPLDEISESVIGSGRKGAKA
ncbi:MAG: tRNA (adenosine(37)-N6)-threonylcarbamoyltransferase complex transferase subunit TsaD [Rhizobiaceae bacterium]|nr:tRNA (adenosine(37)-N6)-threonylcarbamoyltransferase complex transferase subunit TsaD [Rhizobiaceae bacterium]MBL4731586.1 tRNA (adenosine(37)-N6)-threonylcarbamoyltransferase complex transferase subunit TsaD [Rhizobiaceae bacterium]